MLRTLIQSCTLILLCVVAALSQSNAWKGLVPLRSSKTDVEKILGKPVPNPYPFSGTKYETADAKVSIDFLEHRCNEGWNVATDTVLKISVQPFSSGGKPENEFSFDPGKQFLFVGDTPEPRIWIDPELGVEYAFHWGEGQQMRLFATTYMPKKTDNDLRCDGYPVYAPEATYMPMERLPFYWPKPGPNFSRVDYAFRVAQVIMNAEANKPEFVAYAVVYFDKRRPLSFYNERFASLKKYIYKRFPNSRNILTFIEGGYQHEAMMETYVIRKDDPPPMPRPESPSPQFMRHTRLGTARHH